MGLWQRQDHADGNFARGAANTAAFSSNQNRGGWTWGSGVEASLGGNWTGKIEYLWVDLGDRLDLFALNGVPQAMSTDIREQIFRVGLNYRINGNGGAYVPLPASNWTGFYLGGNIGSGIGRDRTAYALTGPAGTSTEFFNLSPDGFNGGIQAGYNWQAANWVFGLEADIQGSSQRDNRACVLTCNTFTAPFIFAAYDATLPWFGTVRGRVGYSVGSTLFYATGGYAYGNVKTKITANFSARPATQKSPTPRAAGRSAAASKPRSPSWSAYSATTGPRRPSISMSISAPRRAPL